MYRRKNERITNNPVTRAAMVDRPKGFRFNRVRARGNGCRHFRPGLGKGDCPSSPSYFRNRGNARREPWRRLDVVGARSRGANYRRVRGSIIEILFGQFAMGEPKIWQSLDNCLWSRVNRVNSYERFFTEDAPGRPRGKTLRFSNVLLKCQ